MLYHSTIHFPKRIRNKLPFGRLTVTYSQHAIQASKDDRYGVVKLPTKVDMGQVEVVEAQETDKNKPLNKVVLRTPLTEGVDLVIVGIPRGKTLFCKTLWLNEASDNHKTLNQKLYAGG